MKKGASISLILATFYGAAAFMPRPADALYYYQRDDEVKTDVVCGDKAPDIDPSLYLWPANDLDSYHGNPARYRKKPMLYCHGTYPPLTGVIYVRPSWDYGRREEWRYPIQIVKTQQGVFAVRGSEYGNTSLLWRGKPFLPDADFFDILAVGDQGDPSVILALFAPKTTPISDGWNVLIDFSGDEPFVSDALPVDGTLGTPMTLRRVDENTYLVSGIYDKDTPPAGPFHGAPATYRYERGTHTLTRVEPPRSGD